MEDECFCGDLPRHNIMECKEDIRKMKIIRAKIAKNYGGAIRKLSEH